MSKLLRPKATWAKLACGKTKFEEHYRFHSADDPFVPNTEIPRPKPVPLGPRNIAYVEQEADELVDALAALHDVAEGGTRIIRNVAVTDGYADTPATHRTKLEEHIRRLKVASWADPGHKDLRVQIEQAE